MTSFDPSQERALRLDPGRHARVLGAPGSGKTALLVENYARALEREGWSENDVLVLAQSRIAASELRGLVARRVRRALGGSPVRTATSFAFSLLSRRAALDGVAPPRLLTGTVQDEAVAMVVQQRLAGEQGAREQGARERGAAAPVGDASAAYALAPEVLEGARALAPEVPEGVYALAPEVLSSAPFRAELRELWRVLDDCGFDATELAARLRALDDTARSGPFTELPDAGLRERWLVGLDLIAEVSARLRDERPDEVSASSLLRRAAAAVRAGDAAVPRLILVDDAQDLGEGALALLSACAGAGAAVWVFGDPDIATGAFQGERTRVLAGLDAELQRAGRASVGAAAAASAGSGQAEQPEQLVVLDTVYRQRADIRGLVRELSIRVGSVGTGAQRAATASREAPEGRVQFARAASTTEQLGIIAHRMRSRRLGLETGRRALDWGDMAVICRTRAEAMRVARSLAAHQVPTGVAAGGVVLREHQIVRELVAVLLHALGVSPLDASGVLRLVGGVIGGLDPVAVRRLRGALLLQERRIAREEAREPDPIDQALYEAFAFPGPSPVIDNAGGRALRRLGVIAAAGASEHAAGATPREVLWAIWDAARLAERWQSDALAGRGARADEANRALDAVVALFFALQRHEEQASEQPVEGLLYELLTSTVPEDSLAQRSERDAVTVTTPQGASGREFALVAVIGVQDGVWPNLRTRGSLLGTTALERWLKGGEALAPSRRDTMHDELRLFVQACSRAGEDLLVVATADEESYPSPFFGFGAAHAVEALPSARLTLRGATAEMRRRAVADPDDEVAVRSIAALAAAGAAGADPAEWYGVLPPSSAESLYAGDPPSADDPLARVPGEPSEANEADGPAARPIPMSPSQLERAETCALDWVIGALGGGSSSTEASLGTLAHHALETAEGLDPDRILAAITAEWHKLSFDADWESERMLRTAAAMAAGLSDYLREFEASERELVGRESRFRVALGRAELRGVADRIELMRTDEGVEITVVDLKTGRRPATKPEAEEHVQLKAYQLGVVLGGFETESVDVSHTSAKLLYVHPDATRGSGYIEREQPELGEEQRREFVQRVLEIAETMDAQRFTARVEHHCSDPHQPGNCRLHIIQAVSHA